MREVVDLVHCLVGKVRQVVADVNQLGQAVVARVGGGRPLACRLGGGLTIHLWNLRRPREEGG